MSSNQENPSSSNPPIAGAITFPSRSVDTMQLAPNQPRQPRNLQGLLRFAMEATKAEDAPGNSDFTPLDEERRKFLEDALRNLTVNVGEVLQKAIKVLTNQENLNTIKAGDELPEDVKVAFGNIMECIDDMDIANDFYKMGGFAIFPVCYSCENDEVRSNASWVLAELCQNNPFCQTQALESGLLNILLNLVQTEQGVALSKCIYALSCACREFPPSCRELVSQGGCLSLAAALGAHAQARTKAAYFISWLCQHQPEARENFIQSNLVQAVTEQIRSTTDDTAEHLLGLLSTLLDGNDPRVLDQCRDPSIGLKRVLQDHLTHEMNNENLDLKELCQELMKNIFEDCPEYEVLSDEVADR